MYSLLDRNGDWARMRNGQRFTYSSRQWARVAALHLYKTHGRLEVTEA